MDQTLPHTLPPPDDPLLRRFVAGEAGACRTVERWAFEVAAYGRFRLPPDEREDVVQDAVAAVWQAASRRDFELRHSLRAFVRQVAAARCIDRIRRRRPTWELSDELPDVVPGPYERLLDADEAARVRWAIQAVGEACRELIRRHFLDSEPYAAIAATENRAESSIRVRMFECMKRIRAVLARRA